MMMTRTGPNKSAQSTWHPPLCYGCHVTGLKRYVEKMADEVNKLTIDLVTQTEDGNYKLILVEQGPWQSGIEENLQRIQVRLYNCVDALIVGFVARKYPESLGKAGIIRLDCYDLPTNDIDSFFDGFTEFIRNSDKYQGAISNSQAISSLAFEISHGPVKKIHNKSDHLIHYSHKLE